MHQSNHLRSWVGDGFSLTLTSPAGRGNAQGRFCKIRGRLDRLQSSVCKPDMYCCPSSPRPSPPGEGGRVGPFNKICERLCLLQSWVGDGGINGSGPTGKDVGLKFEDEDENEEEPNK